MSDRTLEQQLESAVAGRNYCINKSFKTGMKAQESMISIYEKAIKKLEKQIKEQK